MVNELESSVPVSYTHLDVYKRQVIYKGYHSDAARTVGVGEISEEATLLIERTRLSFFAGIKTVSYTHLKKSGVR